MSKHENPFRFKKFQVYHHRSSIKVGFDAVTLGAWAELPSPKDGKTLSILDVGSGCGVIAMMMAQRYPNTIVTGIDVDKASIEECLENFCNCDWADRLKIEIGDFIEYSRTAINRGIKYDCIISNPPYYSAGLEKPDTPRLIARHQSGLNPLNFVTAAKDLLTPGGIIAFVIPSEQVQELLKYCESIKLGLSRILIIKDREESLSKRTLVELKHSHDVESVQRDILIVRDNKGEYSNEYKRLCRDFFLKF